MALSIRDYTIIKVVQATHHQGDVMYGISRGIECLCMSLLSVTWTMFKRVLGRRILYKSGIFRK